MRIPVLVLSLAMLAACQPAPPTFTGGDIPELQLIDLQPGDGREARAGDQVRVHYSGWLHQHDAPDGRGARFDSSLERGEPLAFRLGAGRVIRGWDEGVVGMREGGTRVLRLPAEYAYGSRGAGNRIPPGASLVFEVELVEVLSD
jgi:FKBP-type peptidyl-prolyl cis-trans isomerase FkpA